MTDIDQLLKRMTEGRFTIPLFANDGIPSRRKKYTQAWDAANDKYSNMGIMAKY